MYLIYLYIVILFDVWYQNVINIVSSIGLLNQVNWIEWN